MNDNINTITSKLINKIRYCDCSDDYKNRFYASPVYDILIAYISYNYKRKYSDDFKNEIKEAIEFLINNSSIADSNIPLCIKKMNKIMKFKRNSIDFTDAITLLNNIIISNEVFSYCKTVILQGSFVDEKYYQKISTNSELKEKCLLLNNEQKEELSKELLLKIDALSNKKLYKAVKYLETYNLFYLDMFNLRNQILQINNKREKEQIFNIDSYEKIVEDLTSIPFLSINDDLEIKLRRKRLKEANKITKDEIQKIESILIRKNNLRKIITYLNKFSYLKLIAYKTLEKKENNILELYILLEPNEKEYVKQILIENLNKFNMSDMTIVYNCLRICHLPDIDNKELFDFIKKNYEKSYGKENSTYKQIYNYILNVTLDSNVNYAFYKDKTDALYNCEIINDEEYEKLLSLINNKETMSTTYKYISKADFLREETYIFIFCESNIINYIQSLQDDMKRRFILLIKNIIDGYNYEQLIYVKNMINNYSSYDIKIINRYIDTNIEKYNSYLDYYKKSLELRLKDNNYITKKEYYYEVSNIKLAFKNKYITQEQKDFIIYYLNKIVDYNIMIDSGLYKTPENNREDLTFLSAITLDDEITKIRDDGFAIEELPNGTYILYSFISDPTNLLRENNKLYENIITRPNLTAEIYSDFKAGNILSLNKNSIRNVHCLKINITKDGEILSHNICDAYIKIKENMNYNQAKKIVDSNNNQNIINKEINDLFTISNALKISQYKLNNTNAGYYMVNNLAIFTNYYIAKILSDKSLPYISYYSKFIANKVLTGYSLEKKPNNILKLDTYTHFTSPIRRICDNYMHDIVRTFLINKDLDDKTVYEKENTLKRIIPILNK